MEFCIVVTYFLVAASSVFVSMYAAAQRTIDDYPRSLIEMATNADVPDGADRLKLEPKSVKNKIISQSGTRLFVNNKYGQKVFVTLDTTPRSQRRQKNMRDNVKYYLHTKLTPPKGHRLYNDDNLYTAAEPKSYFDVNHDTVFVTHGWTNDADSPSCTLIRDAYVKKNYNVIVVDWSDISIQVYGYSASRVKDVGREVASMISRLESCGQVKYSRLTLVGHSLGAHVMGIAGFNSPARPAKIFGLDPAYPLFKNAVPGDRISALDAEYVEIIHTNAGYLGFYETLGHADYYVNGGSIQDGCVVDLGFACSHCRAYEYFAESINTPKHFWGKQCESARQFMARRCVAQNVAIMGGTGQDYKIKGIFYVSTGHSSPYALGRDG